MVCAKIILLDTARATPSVKYCAIWLRIGSQCMASLHLLLFSALFSMSSQLKAVVVESHQKESLPTDEGAPEM